MKKSPNVLFILLLFSVFLVIGCTSSPKLEQDALDQADGLYNKAQDAVREGDRLTDSGNYAATDAESQVYYTEADRNFKEAVVYLKEAAEAYRQAGNYESAADAEQQKAEIEDYLEKMERQETEFEIEEYETEELEKDSASSESGEVLDKIKQTIVWIKYDVTTASIDGSYSEESGTGSGVITLNEDGELTVYTNRHVVDCAYFDSPCFDRIDESIQVRTQDGKIHDVDQVSFSESGIDLAILTIKLSNAKDYDFAYYTDEFEVNDKVIAVGYPGYADNVVEFSVSKGKITNIKETLSQSTGDSFRVLESDAYTYFGSSGGGLFDEYGDLIGINTWIEGTQTSIAIDFNSTTDKDFVYCPSDSYFTEDGCEEY